MMKDMEQIIAAKDAFLAALDAMPDNVEGMCALTVTDRKEDVIAANNTTDIVAATRCLSGLAASARRKLALSEEQAASMFSVAAANTLVDMHPQIPREKSEVCAHTAVALFASAVSQVPGTTGLCAGAGQNAPGEYGFVSAMSREQAITLCADCILDIMSQGIVSSQDCDEFLADIKQCMQRKRQLEQHQRSTRRRPRRRGGSPIHSGSAKKMNRPIQLRALSQIWV